MELPPRSVDLWIIKVGNTEQSPPPDGVWDELVRAVVADEWGLITAERVGSTEKLMLRFHGEFGFLEYWGSDDGPVSGARFPNRSLVTDVAVEFPCNSCGISLERPEE